MKVLNNLVTELLNTDELAGTYQDEWVFTNPRDGWVFFSTEASTRGSEELYIGLGSGLPGEALIVHQAKKPDSLEAMRYLPAGKHRLRVCSKGKPLLRKLVIRAIPELIFCKFQYDPHIPEYGPYDWDFLQRHVLPNVNTIVGSGDDKHLPYVREWKGRKWIAETPATPYFQGWDAEEAYRHWSKTIGFREPLLDGIIVDEFGGGDDQRYPSITESIRRLRRDERFSSKVLYPYCGSMYGAKLSEDFIRAVMESGYRFAWERYLREQPDEAAAAQFLESRLSREMKDWEDSFPGCTRHMIVCLGYMVITESLNVNPEVDYKVWMDMQFQHLAKHPAFAGLYGLMEYTCGYADEETVRWAARLYRHYALEGQTELLSKQYGFRYTLEHIQNPDFGEGLSQWTVDPAEEGSIAAKSVEGYSWLQGRYPRTNLGDTFLWTRRSDRKPNIFAQEIRKLRPGEKYSLKMITADYGDLSEGRSVQTKHPISIRIDGVKPDPERSFQSVIPNNYAHRLEPFDDKHKAWFNYHWQVFTASSTTAGLTVSDWINPQEPGGSAGQELMYNFIEIQPYWGGHTSTANTSALRSLK